MEASSRKAQNELWEHHRRNIEHLYINEGKKLDEVRNLMATNHGFHKTYVKD